MKITLNKYQQLMASALELGNIDVSGPSSTGKTYFAAHWAAEKVRIYMDDPTGADVVLQVSSLRRGWVTLLGAFQQALGRAMLHSASRGGGTHAEVGNVTVHFVTSCCPNLGPVIRPVFFVQDAELPWGSCLDIPEGFRGIRILESSHEDKEFCLDINPVDGGELPRHNQL